MAIDPITAALDIGGKLIDRLWPDPTQRDAARLELLKLQQSGDLAQITGQLKINEIEAASPSLFVSGWRPAVGWVCVAGLAYQFLIYPIALSWLPGISSLDMGTLLTLLLGMLGIGGLRTAEKLQGVAAK
jgi:hypothetical protein